MFLYESQPKSLQKTLLNFQDLFRITYLAIVDDFRSIFFNLYMYFKYYKFHNIGILVAIWTKILLLYESQK